VQRGCEKFAALLLFHRAFPLIQLFSSRMRIWLVFAVLCLIWGSTWVATDSLTDLVPPLFAAAVRFLLSSLILIPVMLFKRYNIPSAGVLAWLSLLSVTMIVLPLILLLWARQNLPSATVTVVFAAMPLIIILLSPVFGENEVPPSAMQAAIAALGSMIVITGASPSLSQAGGAAVVLVAVLSNGISLLFARREFQKVNPLVLAASLLGASSAFLFLASMVLERGQPAHWNRKALIALVFLAVVGGAIAYAIYFWLLQRLSAHQVATVQWVEPLVAILESAVFLRIGLSISMIAGAGVTLVCLWLVLRARSEDDDTVSLRGI
jgi:putative membrane protein PagO